MPISRILCVQSSGVATYLCCIARVPQVSTFIFMPTPAIGGVRHYVFWSYVRPSVVRPLTVTQFLCRWRRGAVGSVGLATKRSWVQVLTAHHGVKTSGQVSHSYVILSPSSITWYWPKGIEPEHGH